MLHLISVAFGLAAFCPWSSFNGHLPRGIAALIDNMAVEASYLRVGCPSSHPTNSVND